MLNLTKRKNRVEQKSWETFPEVDPGLADCGKIPKQSNKNYLIYLRLLLSWSSISTLVFSPRYMYKDKGLKMPHEKINQLRQERMRVKLLENRLKEEERARREDLKKRREINKQRMEANARKGEIVQVVSLTHFRFCSWKSENILQIDKLE